MKQPTDKGSTLLKAFGWIAALSILAYIARLALKSWDVIVTLPWSFDPAIFALACAVQGAAFFFIGATWLLLLRLLGDGCPSRRALGIYFYTSLGRYIPGKIWQTAGSAAMARHHGHSGLAFGMASVYLMLLNTASGLILTFFGITFLDTTIPLDQNLKLVLAVGSLGSLCVFHPTLNRAVLRLINRVFKANYSYVPLSFPKVLLVLALLLLHWPMEALALQLFVKSYYPVSLALLPTTTVIVAFTSTMGFLAIFMPAGLGVREGLFVLLLPLIMPAPVAVVTTILFRLWFTVMDVGTVGLACAVFKPMACAGRD